MTPVSEWREVELGDVLTLQRGFDLPKKDRRPGPFPVISSSGFTGFHEQAKVEPPGVVVGRYGSIGSVHWVDQPYWPHNTSLWVKDFKGNNEKFVYYLLKTVAFDGSGAAAVPGVNRNHLHKLSVTLPDIRTQIRVASLLSSFDDLIEINERRIELLEDLARSLYREWFVHFRYPGHHEAEFEGSEVGLLPSDWSVRTLAEICELMKAGSTPRRSERANWKNGLIPWFKTGELQDGPLFDSVEHVTGESGARIFEDGTILMAIYGSPTVGRLGWLTGESSCNQAALAMRAAEPNTEQEWLWHKLFELRAFFNSLAQGAAQQNISKQKVAATRVAFPSSQILKQFSELAGETRRLTTEIYRSSREVTGLRDLLLPRLISGKLDISEIDLGVLEPKEAA